ncbi:hypothetical protein K438DRAFT_1748559 [Mycena galopus ATCC 62051]|nr:hypothetical protein K438DRAFT_1748559 [Mycena galopus ATCC 62051]
MPFWEVFPDWVGPAETRQSEAAEKPPRFEIVRSPSHCQRKDTKLALSMNCGPMGTHDATSTRLVTAGSARAARNSMRRELLATSTGAGAAGDRRMAGAGGEGGGGRTGVSACGSTSTQTMPANNFDPCCAILVAWAAAGFLPHATLVKGMNRRRWCAAAVAVAGSSARVRQGESTRSEDVGEGGGKERRGMTWRLSASIAADANFRPAQPKQE